MSPDFKSTFEDISSDVSVFRGLFDAMPQLSWTATADGYIDFYNRGWYEFTGTTYESMKGWGWEVVHDPEILPLVKERFIDSLTTGNSFEMEFPLRRHDGVFEWFLTRVNPLRNSNGEIVRWVGINTNVQALKQSQELLLDKERRFVTMANSLPNIVWRTDRELNVEFFNERWYQYTGLTEEQSMGKGWRQSFTEEMLQKMDADWDRAICEKTSYEGEQLVRSQAGEYRWFLTRGYPHLDDVGNIVAWFGTTTDIHEQKRTSELLERKVVERTAQLVLEKDKAIAADEAKSTFVANVSHEIRNPLTGIIAALELLMESVDEAGDKDLMSSALQTAQGLLHILNDLLDSSKLDAGKVELDLNPFCLNAIIEEVVTLLKPKAEAKGLTLDFNAQSGARLNVCGDELRMRQILVNLGSNAIKFTEKGHVEISLYSRKEDSNLIVALIEVKDSGIGIDADKLDLLFQPYSQIIDKSVGYSGGTGLGLSICKRLVTLMGGTIGVRSTVGSGSVFWMEIPFAEKT